MGVEILKPDLAREGRFEKKELNASLGSIDNRGDRPNNVDVFRSGGSESRSGVKVKRNEKSPLRAF